MDLISENKAFKRKTLIIWSAILFLLHILYTLISLKHAYINGDIMQKNLTAILEILAQLTALLIVYLRCGVLVSVYHSYKKGTLTFTLAALLSLLVTRICQLLVYGLVYSDFASNLIYYILSAMTNFMIDLAVVLLLLLISRNRGERNRPIRRLALFACLIPFAIAFFEELYIFIRFLVDINRDYGSMAMTGDEVLSVILAFVRPIVNALLGFVIISVTHKILKAKSKPEIL